MFGCVENFKIGFEDIRPLFLDIIYTFSVKAPGNHCEEGY